MRSELSMIRFGGNNKTRAKETVAKEYYFNDTWEYNLDSGQWQEILPKGPIPRGRFRQGATVCGEEIYYFGGSDGTHMMRDWWVYNTRSKPLGTWYGHCMQLIISLHRNPMDAYPADGTPTGKET